MRVRDPWAGMSEDEITAQQIAELAVVDPEAAAEFWQKWTAEGREAGRPIGKLGPLPSMTELEIERARWGAYARIYREAESQGYWFNE